MGQATSSLSRRYLLVICFFWATTLIVRSSDAQITRIFSAAGDASESFGRAVAVDGDLMVVGAPDHYRSQYNVADDYGAVYVFERIGSSWIETEKIIPEEPFHKAHFGKTVALDGNTLVVGAPYAPNYNTPGTVYIYERDQAGWTLILKLRLSDGGAYADKFGWSLAIKNGRLIVGGIAKLPGNNEFKGAVYVFEKIDSEWIETAILTAESINYATDFGRSIDLDVDVVVVGASLQAKSSVEYSDGAVYVFRKLDTGWVQEAELTVKINVLSAWNKWFGYAVTLDGDHLLVGEPRDVDLTTDIEQQYMTGAVFAFEFDGQSWNMNQKFYGSRPSKSSNFGSSLDLSGEVLLVGSPSGGQYEPGGAVYAFEYSDSGWTESVRMVVPENLNNGLGINVTISGEYFFVGATRLFRSYGESGGVVVFENPVLTTGKEVLSELPAAYSIDGPYPNPFSSRTAITLRVNRTERVEVSLYDMLGRQVRNVFSGVLTASQTVEIPFDGSRLANGPYLIRVQGDSFSESLLVSHVN